MITQVKKDNNYMEMQIMENGLIAFASFIHHKSKDEVEIRDIKIEPLHQNEEVRNYILQEIVEYGNNVNAKKVVHYCHGMGSGLSVDEELKWFLENGFVLDHVVFEITPCVVLDLKK